jgi:hypothetical protein
MRRAIAATALASTAILLPAVALASSGSGSAATAAAAATRCPRAHLTSWIGLPGDGAAGSTFYQLEISNISGTTCTLFGFPGVSAIGPNGKQLGSAAGRSHSHTPHVVTLAPHQTAHVLLQVANVVNFPAAACKPTTADGLRVFAPGDFTAMTFPFSFRACAKSGRVYLHVSTTIAGTGIPGYST